MTQNQVAAAGDAGCRHRQAHVKIVRCALPLAPRVSNASTAPSLTPTRVARSADPRTPRPRTQACPVSCDLLMAVAVSLQAPGLAQDRDRGVGVSPSTTAHAATCKSHDLARDSYYYCMFALRSHGGSPCSSLIESRAAVLTPRREHQFCGVACGGGSACGFAVGLSLASMLWAPSFSVDDIG